MTSLFGKLKQALVNSSGKISNGIDHIFFKKKLDDQTLQDLENLLISADIGIALATQLTSSLKSRKFAQEATSTMIKESLAELIVQIFSKHHQPFILKDTRLNIILISGVNGNGKTTSIGKLAAKYINQGKKVSIAACDTFRAAAVDQLSKWATETGALFYSGLDKADPASIAFEAIQKSLEENVDLLFIDTAGRLHNQQNLMDELAKIVRIIKKIDETAPHHSLLVIDATTGQNAYNQVEQFSKIANVTGLIVTKLDGTAKAGVVAGVVQKFALPVHFIGIGEKVEDLKDFDIYSFAKALAGLG